jgi:acetyl-CoA carboxylase alpha subunit
MERFSALSASARAASLADPGTLRPIGDTSVKAGYWTGLARIAGRRVALAITDGHVQGGTLGVEEAKSLARLVAAAERNRAAVVVCWDTGGVRVHEGSPALAAASAVGVALTRLALLGVPVVSVVCGPRGCFGAPAVIAAASHALLATDDAHWGLTGPELLELGQQSVEAALGRQATSAQERLASGLFDDVVPDTEVAVRDALARFLALTPPRRQTASILDACAEHTEQLAARLAVERRALGLRAAPGVATRQRDFFRYSFRGRWQPSAPPERCGLVHTAWGLFDGRPMTGIIVGPERSSRGIGIEEAGAVVRAVRLAVARGSRARAPIAIFLFCRGHANDLAEERAGLPAALAECLRSLVLARLVGHPIVCVLGGGAYGAAFLALAAPSHRIVAMRGTSVAPMSPRVLAAFKRLRGIRESAETPQDLAKLIPEIRILESVVRLPAALGEEIDRARQTARRRPRTTTFVGTRPHRDRTASAG